jgi:hypothetical protein
MFVINYQWICYCGLFINEFINNDSIINEFDQLLINLINYILMNSHVHNK